ncbi:hypothetical protein BDZ94DRAFT_1264740 [Collybia nuda]|uniref:F-box domain-containing protein n=1 Tax=Collybia nuda TaxID=64659 RepID=A0A9P5Y3V9_9AGAR|nr:hypothetical protein BDZ94DRAFT_1264740 [Collybia nuda]
MMDLEARASSSNDILSDIDQSAIRGLLKEGEKYIEFLNKAIDSLSVPDNNIHERRMEGLARIERLRIAIAPHKKVPAEIWSEIFTYCVDRPLLYLPPLRTQPIWTVMAVCSRWRQIVLAEPRIWNNLRADDKKDAKYMNELLNEIFSNRGGNGMIRYWAPWITNISTWDDLTRLLSTYPSRVRHLGLEFRNFFPPTTPTTPINLEHLESIYFSYIWQDSYDKDAMPATDFFTSEALQNVAISIKKTTSPAPWPSRISLPWAQLTDLSVGIVSVSMVRPVLMQCTQLVKLSIHLRGEPSCHDLSHPPLHLGHLQSLSFMVYSDYSESKYFINVLYVPKLKILSLGDQYWTEWPQMSLLSLINRSNCPLERLTTSDLALEGADVVQLLRATPHLIEFFGYTKGYIPDAILNTIRTEKLAPKLRVLDGLQVQSLKPFIELVQSRCSISRIGERHGIWATGVAIPENHPAIDEGYYKDALDGLKNFGIDIDVYRA